MRKTGKNSGSRRVLASTFTAVFWFLLAGAVSSPNPAPFARDQSFVSGEFIFQRKPAASCHASTIVETRARLLVAAWYGGTREGHPDVSIWVSRHDGRSWLTPVRVAEDRQPDRRKRNPCWNPVLTPGRTDSHLLHLAAGIHQTRRPGSGENQGPSFHPGTLAGLRKRR
jgi:hypothetical protein